MLQYFFLSFLFSSRQKNLKIDSIPFLNHKMLIFSFTKTKYSYQLRDFSASISLSINPTFVCVSLFVRLARIVFRSTKSSSNMPGPLSGLAVQNYLTLNPAWPKLNSTYRSYRNPGFRGFESRFRCFAHANRFHRDSARLV